MKYLLDSNTVIYYLNNKSEELITKFKSVKPDDIALCSIVKAELIYGAMKSLFPERNLNKIEYFFGGIYSLPFDDNCAKEYGKIRSYLEINGISIGPNDLKIAATAVFYNLILVTNNLKEFSRVQGLNAVNWLNT